MRASPSAPPILWRSTLPWYWTDEISALLTDSGRINEPGTAATPIGIRRSEETIEEAAGALLEEGEIDLAA